MSESGEAKFAEIIASARAWLEDEAEQGGIGVPRVALAQPPAAAVSKASAVAPASQPQPAAPASGARRAPEPARPPVEVTTGPMIEVVGGKVHLGTLADRVRTCTACGLHATRTQTVFARGNEQAELVFVGEGPGRDEDLSGLPFVGAAGQLLDKMVAAMGYQRDEVYICNVVKCRPPENRTPLPNEAAACEPYLTAQLQTVAPKVIVALGKCAAMNLRVAEETGRWRGIWREWNGIPVMPTYHPAFLLRSPERKRDVWEDLQQVMTRLGKPVGPRRG